jgi:sodium-dependent dicarboxylate transporter 2/3/5
MSDVLDEPEGTLSPLEERVEHWRKRVGLFLAPIAFTTVLLLNFPGLKPEAHRLAAIMAAVIVLWITEAISMPVTALLGASACVVLRVADAKTVFAPFADPLMFLFIGSFILARAIFLHGLNRRVAFGVLSLRWVGAKPERILCAFGAATAAISAWISNTATTAMMFAIGLSIIQSLKEQTARGGSKIDPRFATGLMLMTSFSASVGGLATPIGTPPNIIGIGFLKNMAGIEVSFLSWMKVGVPVVICVCAALFVYLSWFCPAGVRELVGSRELLERERQNLGPWTRGQISTLVAFLVTVCLWVGPGILELVLEQSRPHVSPEAFLPWKNFGDLVKKAMPEAVASLMGATLLFLLPGKPGERAISWKDAAQIDWGVILLYGGGFGLGVLSNQTGLAEALGRWATTWLPTHSEFGLLVTATILACLLSETTSNTAAANIIVPVVINIAISAKVDPLMPALGATMGASLGFMLPVSTPCNAIVYGSGLVPLPRMIRYGAILDVIGVVLIILLVRLIAPTLR